MIKIDNKTFKKSELEFLDSISYPEFKEFVYYTETLYKSPDGVFIIGTEYQKSAEYYEEELCNGDLTDKDMEQKTEYRIVSAEEAEGFLEDSVWRV